MSMLSPESADDRRPEPARPVSLARRIQQYYMQPDPGTLRQLFAESWEAGLFRFKNGRPNPITVTFFAAALDATGEAGWEGFIDEMLSGPLPALAPTGGFLSRLLNRKPGRQDRLGLVALIAFLSRSKEQRPLRYFLQRTLPPSSDLTPQLAAMERDLAALRPQAEINNPLQLDQLWAFFYATGDEGALRKVIAVADDDAIAPAERLRGTPWNRAAIVQAAAFSLIELAPRQSRISQIIYTALEDYSDRPVYQVLLTALERAGIAQLTTGPDGTLEINFRLPPEWA